MAKYFLVHHYRKDGKFIGYMLQKRIEGGEIRNIALIFKRRIATFFMQLLNPGK